MDGLLEFQGPCRRLVTVTAPDDLSFTIPSGKVLGVDAVAHAQTSFIVVITLKLTRAIESDFLSGTAPLVLFRTLVWPVLGFAFYCGVYASARSMAERQDRVQRIALPMSQPITFSYFIVIITGANNSASTFFKFHVYVAPTTPFATPLLAGVRVIS
ncbi:MAG TPA: hypothetical protein VMU68_04360 [Acidimicrobiales bacterium]|nr:hypothetical protein [Acidimicrobiales bacterium]